MKMLTKAIAAKLPPLGTGSTVAQVKFFDIAGSGTWYGTEFDGEDIFYGFVTGLAADEWGTFSLSELQSIRWHGIPRIERDKWFRPVDLKDGIAA